MVGLDLLASGAKKGFIETLAHRGISVSYTTIMNTVKELSSESLARVVEIAHQKMFSIIWDNINIAFRVVHQRVESKDHFDNGTTATLIPLFDPRTGEY